VAISGMDRIADAIATAVKIMRRIDGLWPLGK
jgi:hypothetical protein